MDEEMKRKIDAILARVKDPESGLSVSRLGLVERVRFNQEKRELYIFADFASHIPSCITCAAIAGTVADGISRSLMNEFEAEFPDLSVMYAPA